MEELEPTAPAGRMASLKRPGHWYNARTTRKLIRIHDAEKERRAHELADARLGALPADEQQAAKDSMAASLKSAADRRCPLCIAMSL